MEALATSSTCPECRGDGYRVEAEVQSGPGDGEGRRARAVARVCSWPQALRALRGTRFRLHLAAGRVQQEGRVKSYEALTPCVCRLLAQRVATFAQVGIPAHHATSSFGTFRAKGDDQEKTAALEQALGVARAVSQDWRRDWPARGFVISGRVGSGKTHLLSAALRHLILERGASARYREISLLFADIRRGFNAGKSGGDHRPAGGRRRSGDRRAGARPGKPVRDGDARRADRPPLQLGGSPPSWRPTSRSNASGRPPPARAGSRRRRRRWRTGRSCWWSGLASASTAALRDVRLRVAARAHGRLPAHKQDGRPTRRLVRPAS